MRPRGDTRSRVNIKTSDSVCDGMRTTLTIDDDVAALLERVQKDRNGTFKAIINEALREGLHQMSNPKLHRKKYHTMSADLGRCLTNIDDIGEALSVAEGDH